MKKLWGKLRRKKQSEEEKGILGKDWVWFRHDLIHIIYNNNLLQVGDLCGLKHHFPTPSLTLAILLSLPREAPHSLPYLTAEVINGIMGP